MKVASTQDCHNDVIQSLLREGSIYETELGNSDSNQQLQGAVVPFMHGVFVGGGFTCLMLEYGGDFLHHRFRTLERSIRYDNSTVKLHRVIPHYFLYSMEILDRLLRLHRVGITYPDFNFDESNVVITNCKTLIVGFQHVDRGHVCGFKNSWYERQPAPGPGLQKLGCLELLHHAYDMVIWRIGYGTFLVDTLHPVIDKTYSIFSK